MNLFKRGCAVVAALLLLAALPVSMRAEIGAGEPLQSLRDSSPIASQQGSHSGSAVITALVEHSAPVPAPRTITVYQSEGGQVLVDAPEVIYDGDCVTFTALSDAGFFLYSAELNGQDVTAQLRYGALTVTVSGDLTLSVRFAAYGNPDEPLSDEQPSEDASKPTPLGNLSEALPTGDDAALLVWVVLCVGGMAAFAIARER